MKSIQRRSSVTCPAMSLLLEQDVRVWFRVVGSEEWLIVGEGFGELPDNTAVQVQVQVPIRRNLAPVVGYTAVSGSGQAQEAIVIGATPDPKAAGYVIHSWTFPVSRDPKATGRYAQIGIAGWPNNRIYVLLQRPGGAFSLYWIGIFSQEYKTWGWVEQASEGVMTRGEQGAVQISVSAPQKALVRALEEAGRFNRRVLVQRETAAPAAVVDITDLARRTGRVRWFSPFMGYGYADYNDDGRPVSVRVHSKNIDDAGRGPAGIRLLFPGDLVSGEVSPVQDARGAQPGVTRLQLKPIHIIRRAA